MKTFGTKIVTLLFSSLAFQTAHSQIVLKDQFPNLTFPSPVGLYSPADGTDRLFVVEQAGRIRVFPNSASAASAKTFLDMRDSVLSGGELGLLGLAFHPDYASNGYFYVDYTRPNPTRTVISRFHVNPSYPDSALRSSEVVIMTQTQPYDNHNGGQIAFGSDRYLYIAFGDGGSGGDPLNLGQNKKSLLGKLLRINVDSTEPGLNYAIPPDNPFVDSIGLKKEIYAYGMRNPWRFSFDQSTVWLGDVGQNSWEEIDTVLKGRNYGWRYMEGSHLYDTSAGGFSKAVLSLPVWEYAHDSGRCSITGGFVYRGANLPQLSGKYIYGDFCTGEVWALDTKQPAPITTKLMNNSANISSFGVDQQQELYLCGLSNGKLYKFALQPPQGTALVSPSNGQAGVSRTPSLIWRTTAWASIYRLQVSTDSTFATTTFDDSTITDTSKVMVLLAPGVKYFWRARGKNSGGSGPYSPKWSFMTINDVVPPAAPFLVSPPTDALDEPDHLSLLWLRSSGATTYHLQLSTDSTFGALYLEDSTLVDTTRQLTSLSFATKYFWRVRAKNAVGTSLFSSIWNFTVALHSTSFQTKKGWNLLSLPVKVLDGRTSTLFPAATSNAYTYDPAGGYVRQDSLVPGTGFWLKFADTLTIDISGTPFSDDTVDVTAGWNMIGAGTSSLSVDSVIHEPQGITQRRFFGYSSVYFETATLQPTRAYWIKATAPGKLIIHTGGSMESPTTEQATLKEK